MTGRVLARLARAVAALAALVVLVAGVPAGLRAHAARTDRAALRAEYHAYLQAEKADPLWDGETDRDLEQLYLDLLHRQPQPATTG